MTGATILFGINYWVAKGLMPKYLLPLQIIFLRIAGALILIWILELLTPAAKQIQIQKKDFPRLAFAALFGITLNQILFFIGLNYTTPVDSAIINSSNPMIVMLLSYLILSQPIKPIKIIGIILGAAGALTLILYGNNVRLGEGGVKGNIFIAFNTLSWSLYLVIAKPLIGKYHPFKVMRWIFLIGFFLALPATIIPMMKINISEFTFVTWSAIAYVIIGTTFLAYLFIIFGLRSLTPSAVSIYTYLQPVIVAVIGICFFNEFISIVKFLAASLIFLGIYLTNKKPTIDAKIKEK
jgi:drug/metabolite transporter (DMT)-like permease